MKFKWSSLKGGLYVEGDRFLIGFIGVSDERMQMVEELLWNGVRNQYYTSQVNSGFTHLLPEFTAKILDGDLKVCKVCWNVCAGYDVCDLCTREVREDE